MTDDLSIDELNPRSVTVCTCRRASPSSAGTVPHMAHRAHVAGVALVCALVLAGCGSTAIHPTINTVPTFPGATSTPDTTVPAIAPLVAVPPPAPAPGVPALPVIGYTHPPSVTGGAYPHHCVARAVPVNELLPDPACTPGSLGDDVTQATIRVTICSHGWTATVRPPSSDTDRVKTAAMVAYGENPSARRSTELDHEIPLELGGSNDVSNLWPEPSDLRLAQFRNRKDDVENALKSAVCTLVRPIALLDAQRAIATDWTTARARLHV